MGADALGLTVTFVPFVAAVASGLVHASLWLDEVTYGYLEDDLALRASELGRAGSSVAPRLGVFFYCDLQRGFHQVVRAFGLTLHRDPELYLRLLSLMAFAAGIAALYVFTRRRTASPLDATLVAGAFGSTPILLHYAFEARVYIFSTLLVVLVGVAVDAAARRPSAGRLLLLGVLAAAAAHSQLWTLCLFFPLLLAGAVDAARARRLTAWSRAAMAAALPALAVIGVQVLYMRATDPGAPLFPVFRRTPPLVTLEQLVFSNFFGILQTQYVVGEALRTAIPAWVGGATLVLLLALALAEGHSRPPDGGPGGKRWAAVAAAAFAFCWLLAVTYGYYTHARYHVPLLGAVFVVLGAGSARTRRLLLALLLTVNVALLPATIRAISLKGSMKQVADRIERSGRRDVTVVCQHVVTGGFVLPAQAIVLDFYLNVLHPGEPEIPILELPDLSRVNGRRGVYDLFAGGAPTLEQYLSSRPDLWRARRAALTPHLYVLRQLWNVEAGVRQNEDFARFVLASGDRSVTAKLFVPGFPRSVLVELRPRPAPPAP
jgi:hypothetical protein